MRTRPEDFTRDRLAEVAARLVLAGVFFRELVALADLRSAGGLLVDLRLAGVLTLAGALPLDGFLPAAGLARFTAFFLPEPVALPDDFLPVSDVFLRVPVVAVLAFVFCAKG